MEDSQITSLSMDLLTSVQIWKSRERRGCNVLMAFGHDDGGRQGWSYLANVRLCPNGVSAMLRMVWHEHGTNMARTWHEHGTNIVTNIGIYVHENIASMKNNNYSLIIA
jgi:hypothetical protein